jgi:hypothetical protein
MTILYRSATDKERMKYFWRADAMPAVRNAELIELELEENGWQLLSTDRVNTDY